MAGCSTHRRLITILTSRLLSSGTLLIPVVTFRKPDGTPMAMARPAYTSAGSTAETTPKGRTG